MNSPRISALDRTIFKQDGYTIVELLIVLGIIILFAGLGLFLSFDTLRSSTFESEVETAAFSMLKARSRAINNINQSAQGFMINSGDFVVYEVNSGQEERIAYNSNLTISGITNFVFQQLTGESPDGLLVITDGVKTATISVNSEGRIDW